MRKKLNGKIIAAPILGARLTAGLQTLNLYIEVQILCPQPFAPKGAFLFKLATCGDIDLDYLNI